MAQNSASFSEKWYTRLHSCFKKRQESDEMWTGVSFTEITFVHKLKRRLDNFSFTSSCVRNLASSSSLMTSSPCLSIYLSITADAAQYHGPKNYSHSVTNLSMKL